MISVTDKAIAALRRIVRNQRASRQELLNSETVPARRTVAVRQRSVEFSDCEKVIKLKQRWGHWKDSLENWFRLWRDNPAVGLAKSPLNRGWVLEVEDEIVGYQGSVPLVYHYGGRTLLAAAGTSLVVEPTYRPHSIGLLASFYRQKDVDLFLITTAIPSVGKLAKVLQAVPLPQRDYDEVFLWVLDARQFLDAVIEKISMGDQIEKLAKPIAWLLLQADLAILRKPPLRIPSKIDVTEIQVQDIGSEFDALWQKHLAKRNRLMADRSAATLRWHFTIPEGPRAVVYRCHHGGRLAGYAVVQTRTDRQTNMQSCSLVDLVAVDDDPDVTESLLAKAYTNARDSGSHVFQISGFPPKIRQILSRWRPYRLRYEACPFWHKSNDENLRRILAHEDAWCASPFDGDTSLMP
jgi:hypothetical protein